MPMVDNGTRKKRVNLQVLVNRLVHTPSVDGIPLYSRLDNSDVENRSDKWRKTAERIYTSPNNVRRIFLTYKRILVQLYKPVIGRETVCWKEIKLKDDESLTNRNKMYIGNPFKGINQGWICSNLEELYIDHSWFISEDMLRNGWAAVYKGAIRGESGKIPREMIEKEIAEAFGTDYIKRFPRLKTIAILSKLDDILKEADRGNSKILEQQDRTFYEIGNNLKLIQENSGVHGILSIRRNRDDIFFLRDGIYKFDDEVLHKLFDEYKRKVKEAYKLNNKKPEVEKISTLESLIDEFIDLHGEDNINRLLTVATYGLPKYEKERAIKEMSKSGKEKYSNIIIG